MTTENINDLKDRLEQSEGLLEALQGEELDAFVRENGVALLRLQEVKDKQRRSTAFSAAMNRINASVHSSLDSNEIMQRLVSECAQVLGSETAAILLRKANAWKVRYVHGQSHNLVGAVMSDDEKPHALLALETGRPIAIGNAMEDPRCNHEHMQQHNIRSVLVVPLIVHAQHLGAIFFNYHSSPHNFTEEEIYFARQIAATASVAMDNARMFEELNSKAEALRNSEKQLQQAMNAGKVFTCEWYPESDAIRRCGNCALILGIDPAACTRDTGRNYFRRIHDEDRKQLTDLLRNLKPEAPNYEVRYRFARDDGSFVWLEESGQAEFDNDGVMVRLQGIAGDITDRMKVLAREKEAAAIVASAQSAIDTVNALGEGVLLFSLDGIITEVNPAVETLLAVGRDELVGRDLPTILPRFLEGKDLAIVVQAIDLVTQGRAPKLKPVVLIRATAAVVTISPAVTCITSPEGTPISGVLTLKDVTELHQAGDLLNQIFDNTHMQMVYLDTNFNFVRVNRAYAEACRRDADFFIGKNHFELYPNPENEAIFQRVRQTGKPFAVCEKAFEFPDQPERGDTYWDWSLRPISNENGTIEGFLLCLLDVTQRVQSRRQVADSEHKYRELVENANSIIMRINPDQRITFFNEYAQQFFGYQANDVIGRNLTGTILPEIDMEGRNQRKMMEMIVEYPEIHSSNENENMCKNGQRVWVHWSNRALRDEYGTVKEILCVGTDVTERRRLAKEAESYRKRLRALADRLTRTEEQGRRHVADHIHDTVVQTLSLANIRLGGVMAAIEEAGLSEPQEKTKGIRALLDQGITECRSLMETLVPSLLYEIGLPAALRDFADKQTMTDGVRVIVEAEEDRKPMEDALRGLLFQCARELIMNALKHAGPCEIRVSLSSTDDNVQLLVEDNGRGFNIVELHGATSDHRKGGFGLFNIRERLDNLGGSLNIDSTPGKGTTVKIQVPVQAAS